MGAYLGLKLEVIVEVFCLISVKILFELKIVLLLRDLLIVVR